MSFPGARDLASIEPEPKGNHFSQLGTPSRVRSGRDFYTLNRRIYWMSVWLKIIFNYVRILLVEPINRACIFRPAFLTQHAGLGLKFISVGG